VNPLPAANPSLAVVLRRVSSAEQADAYGFDVQERDCRTFAKREGLTIVADFAEDARSTVPLDERPAGREALDAMLRHGAGVLLLARRDRLARDPYIAGHAKRAVALAGGHILYAEGGNGDDDSALFMDDIQHAVAAHERRVIVARLRQGREAKAARHPTSRAQGGRVPHGYVRTATGLAVDPAAAAEVRRVFELVREGKPLRTVAATLADETGRAWRASTVEGIVKREDYKRANPTRIIDPRIWNAAQTALASRRRRAA
jgi:DNA invertase Pin-like site-specific DNA recombinase